MEELDMENINMNILGTVDIQKLDNSLLVIAKQKILDPENKIIVERFDTASSLQYQQEIGTEYRRISSGIILAR